MKHTGVNGSFILSKFTPLRFVFLFAHSALTFSAFSPKHRDIIILVRERGRRGCEQIPRGCYVALYDRTSNPRDLSIASSSPRRRRRRGYRILQHQDTSDPHETLPKCFKTQCRSDLRHRIEEKSGHFGPRTIPTRHSSTGHRNAVL